MEKYYFVELRAHSFSKTYLVPRCESIRPVGISYSFGVFQHFRKTMAYDVNVMTYANRDVYQLTDVRTTN